VYRLSRFDWPRSRATYISATVDSLFSWRRSGTELHFEPDPCRQHLEQIHFLTFRPFSPWRRSIALAEALAASAIAPFDEAGGQVVAPAIAADKLFRFGDSGCFHLGTFRLGLLSSIFLADLFGRSPRRTPLSTLSTMYRRLSLRAPKWRDNVDGGCPGRSWSELSQSLRGVACTPISRQL